MTDPTLPLPDEDDEPAAEMTVAENIENSRGMADNLMECPSSEQHLSNIQAVTAQAIRNLCDVVEELDARLTAEAPTDPTEISIDTIRLNHFIVHTCRFRIDMATGETHCRDQKYKTLRDAIDADRGAPAEASATDQVDRCIKDIIDWCKRSMPYFQKGPEFEVAKKFDDELHEICRRYITGPREPADPAPLWLACELVDFLNALVETDRDAVRALFNSRVPCNQKLADDPTIQVRAYGMEDKPHDFEVGILGLLNGFVGVDEDSNGVIQMVVDDEDEEHIEFRVAVE